ncbi:MAG: SRPBCC family protein [Ilumatobacteraceae bacterium]
MAHKVDIMSGCEIARPAADVWAVVADFSRNTEWQGGMRSCEWITDPPIAVGSRYAQEASFLGRTIRVRGDRARRGRRSPFGHDRHGRGDVPDHRDADRRAH